MTFIPSTSTTYVTATSYLSVEDADEIIEAQEDSGGWSGYSDAVKEVILNQSSLAVDGVYPYQNSKTDEDQLLKFPRGSAEIVPDAVRIATAMMAIQYARDEAMKNITSEKIKALTITFGALTNGVSKEVSIYLQPLKCRTLKLNQA